MKTHTDFAKSSPRTKASMVLDGYEHLAAQFEKLAKEQKVLNAWINELPSHMEEGRCISIDLFNLAEMVDKVSLASDELTEQLVKHVHYVEKLTKYLTKRKA